MSDPIVNNLRRQIEDQKPKPGTMSVGFPKVSVYLCDLEGLIARYEVMAKEVSRLTELADKFKWQCHDTLERALRAEQKGAALMCALEWLYGDTVEYIKLNNLGDPHHNQVMKIARDTIVQNGGKFRE